MTPEKQRLAIRKVFPELGEWIGKAALAEGIGAVDPLECLNAAHRAVKQLTKDERLLYVYFIEVVVSRDESPEEFAMHREGGNPWKRDRHDTWMENPYSDMLPILEPTAAQKFEALLRVRNAWEES